MGMSAHAAAAEEGVDITTFCSKTMREYAAGARFQGEAEKARAGCFNLYPSWPDGTMKGGSAADKVCAEHPEHCKAAAHRKGKAQAEEQGGRSSGRAIPP